MQSTQCPDKERKIKKKFDIDFSFSFFFFLSRGLTYQKREISPSVEYKFVQLETGEWE